MSEYNERKRKSVTFELDSELADNVSDIAKSEHRSMSGQVAFFCEQGVSKLNTPCNSPAEPAGSYKYPQGAE
jgi:hypothetical protein